MNPRNFLFIWESRVLFIAGGISAEGHSHYSASFLISTDVPFLVRTKRKELRELNCVLIAPNVYHELHAPNSRMIVLQLEPLSAEYSALARALGDDDVVSVEGLGSDFAAVLHRLVSQDPVCADALSFVRLLLSQAAHFEEPPAPDARIGRLIALLKDRIAEDMPDQLSVLELAPLIGLSPDRLMHLFKEEMGLPIRRYLLWLKLRRAVMLMRTEGISMTEASHAAGFADSAHLSRTFKEMFGIKPSFFFSDDRFIQVHQCEVW